MAIFGESELSKKFVPEEPLVTHYNKAMFSLQWMTRGCCEYLLRIVRSANGAVQLDRPDTILQAANRNVDLAWVVHFLYDYAFLVFDFKQKVRCNDSRGLDVLWREFFAIGRTGTANKKLYTQMAIMRIWWADAMNSELSALYHALRSIPMSRTGNCVGWDTPIEWLNLAITLGVVDHVSEERITQFVKNFAFTDACTSQLISEAGLNQTLSQTHMKSIQTTTERLVSHLEDRVGATWEIACRRNYHFRLNIDARIVWPWQEMRRKMSDRGRESVPAYVAEHVRKYTSSFYTFSP